jgi:hypothetical protein
MGSFRQSCMIPQIVITSIVSDLILVSKWDSAFVLVKNLDGFRMRFLLRNLRQWFYGNRVVVR